MGAETLMSTKIPTAEIEQDIRDTEQEIAVTEAEIASLLLIPHASGDYKMAQFRIGARRTGIEERRVFIEKLRAILAERASGEREHG